MTGDCHAGICGSPGVKFPRATRLATKRHSSSASGCRACVPRESQDSLASVVCGP